MVRLNRDLLNNVDRMPVRQGSFAIVDALQMEPPQVQAASIGAAFVLMCERFKLEPQDVFLAVNNMMCLPNGERAPEFKGAALYMQNEWKRP
jgi:hypothetical protein